MVLRWSWGAGCSVTVIVVGLGLRVGIGGISSELVLGLGLETGVHLVDSAESIAAARALLHVEYGSGPELSLCLQPRCLVTVIDVGAAFEVLRVLGSKGEESAGEGFELVGG